MQADFEKIEGIPGEFDQLLDFVLLMTALVELPEDLVARLKEEVVREKQDSESFDLVKAKLFLKAKEIFKKHWGDSLSPHMILRSRHLSQTESGIGDQTQMLRHLCGLKTYDRELIMLKYRFRFNDKDLCIYFKTSSQTLESAINKSAKAYGVGRDEYEDELKSFFADIKTITEKDQRVYSTVAVSALIAEMKARQTQSYKWIWLMLCGVAIGIVIAFFVLDWDQKRLNQLFHMLKQITH